MLERHILCGFFQALYEQPLRSKGFNLIEKDGTRIIDEYSKMHCSKCKSETIDAGAISSCRVDVVPFLLLKASDDESEFDDTSFLCRAMGSFPTNSRNN